LGKSKNDTRIFMLNPARDLSPRWLGWRISACAGALAFAIAFCPDSTLAQTPTPHPDSATTQTQKPTPVPPADPKRAKDAFARGRQAETDKNWREAFADYSEAARALPDNRQYAIQRDVARSQLVQAYVDRAERDAVSGRMQEARAGLSAAIALDPGDAIARERWNELSAPEKPVKKDTDESLSGLTYLNPAPGTHDFKWISTRR